MRIRSGYKLVEALVDQLDEGQLLDDAMLARLAASKTPEQWALTYLQFTRHLKRQCAKITDVGIQLEVLGNRLADPSTTGIDLAELGRRLKRYSNYLLDEESD